MNAQRSSHGGPTIPEDGIFITDRGIGKRSEAFHWLMLGFHVFDHEFRELTVRDLEHNIDPTGVMSPMYVRGALWKTVPQCLWLANRGGRNGPEPAQPGLNVETSVKYYDRGPTEIHQGDRVLEVPQVENKSHQGWSSPLHTHLRSSGTSPSMSPEKLLHRSRPTSPLLDESLKSPSCRVHGFVKSMSVTSLSGKSLQSSPTRRRGRSISTESDFHTQETSITREPQNGWRETCWTKKGETPEDRLSSKGEGVDEPATGKESRARLDSFLARRPSSSEGEVYSGEN